MSSLFSSANLGYSKLAQVFQVYHRIIQNEYGEEIESKLRKRLIGGFHIGDHETGSSQGNI